ncbi:hypothetical protein HFP15_41455 [Amycolatopsis sp. K13G38]|uniref:Uncharacterized protein n=1 Tax=Amycolatopsis acididurans TaxID=2724524 RepID=A0ABX1JHN9_9PSEU|nr:hypothetical protein [Amycolatopsis acididurans]NKQ59323.1 hypothetical protein [Amycolatopsis acididurans]
MTKIMTIGNPGTMLSCAIPMSAAAGQGAGMRWSERALFTTHGVRVRLGNAAFDLAAPAYIDVPTAKQPKYHVPHPLLERSP